jgi:hypothetical protein
MEFEVVSSNPVYGQVYLIQHYEITFISDLRQVGGFFRVIGKMKFQNKNIMYIRCDIAEILQKLELSANQYTKCIQTFKTFMTILYSWSQQITKP